MSRFDAILNILKKGGSEVGGELGGASDDILKYLKGSGVSKLDRSLGMKPKGLMADLGNSGAAMGKMADDAGKGAQDYYTSARNMFGSPGPMTPEDLKRQKLLKMLGLGGLGAAGLGGAGYAMAGDED